MLMQTKLSIVTSVGVGALLLAALALIVAPRAQIAHAQSLAVDIGLDSVLTRGEESTVVVTVLNLPEYPSDSAPLRPRYRIEVLKHGTTEPVDACHGLGMGSTYRRLSTYTGPTKYLLNNHISGRCPPGLYTVRVQIARPNSDDGEVEDADDDGEPDDPAEMLVESTSDLFTVAGSSVTDGSAPYITVDLPSSFWLSTDPNRNRLRQQVDIFFHNLANLPPEATLATYESKAFNRDDGTWDPYCTGQQLGYGEVQFDTLSDVQEHKNEGIIPYDCPVGFYMLEVVLEWYDENNDVEGKVASYTTVFDVIEAPDPSTSDSSSSDSGSSDSGSSDSDSSDSGSSDSDSSDSGSSDSGSSDSDSSGSGSSDSSSSGSGSSGGGSPSGGSPPSSDGYTPRSQPGSQAPLAVTVPEIMNVRSGPGLVYDVVATIPAGTQATIIGIDPTDEWFQVEIAGIDGPIWIYQDLTTLYGSLIGVRIYSSQEIAQLFGGGAGGTAPLAVTVPITMNVRSGPGLTYDVVRVVPQGTQGRIWGIDPTGDWFQIELEGLDTLVWVYQDLTTVIGSLAGVRRLTTAEIALLPAVITQPLLLNARAGPGTNYDILTTVPQGTWLQITGIDAQGDWYRVELADLDQPAWLFRDLTKVAGGSLAGLIRIAVGGSPSQATSQELLSSITVELALPQVGGVDLTVNWIDAGPCTQLYHLYHRSGADTTAYTSLDTATTASTANSRSLSFSTLSGSSFISAWCGTNSAGREVAEVEIDPAVAGAYSSSQPVTGGVAAVPSR